MRRISKTEYETPPDYRKLNEDTIFSIPGEQYRTPPNSNYYYPDNSTHTDVFNLKPCKDEIITSIKKSTVHQPVPLQFDQFMNDFFCVAQCKRCNKFFTRYEKYKNTLKYIYCNSCCTPEKKSSSCLKCCNIM